MKIGIYAGSFDPVTFGHMFMINQGSKLFDKLIVAIGRNPAKKGFFTVEERIDMLQEAIQAENLINVEVTEYTNQFLIHYAQAQNAKYILRGIRNAEDFGYEIGIKEINARIDSSIETIFLAPPRNMSDISSSVVRGLIGYDGWKEIAKQYVPENVFNRLISKE